MSVVVDWPQPPRPARPSGPTPAPSPSPLDAARQAQSEAEILAANAAGGIHRIALDVAQWSEGAAALPAQRPGVAAELRLIAADLAPKLARLRILLDREPG